MGQIPHPANYYWMLCSRILQSLAVVHATDLDILKRMLLGVMMKKQVVWLDTAEQGAVLVKVEQGRVDWRTWADTQMRFWHSPQHSFMR